MVVWVCFWRIVYEKRLRIYLRLISLGKKTFACDYYRCQCCFFFYFRFVRCCFIRSLWDLSCRSMLPKLQLRLWRGDELMFHFGIMPIASYAPHMYVSLCIHSIWHFITQCTVWMWTDLFKMYIIWIYELNDKPFIIITFTFSTLCAVIESQRWLRIGKTPRLCCVCVCQNVAFYSDSSVQSLPITTIRFWFGRPNDERFFFGVRREFWFDWHW